MSNDIEQKDKQNGISAVNSSLEKGGKVMLEVKGVSKKFCRHLKRSMLYGIKDLARSMVGIKTNTSELRESEFWALKDIDITLRKGEALGIIGANGSGKSTLLRILTGIFPPDTGRIQYKGRMGGIIALNAGMHPHMTGRENIYLNGSIFGMSTEEIDSKFDAIVDFADIGDFLDAPFNTYSSGMRVRLGFAVAVHFEPDILVIDEVLAVGDMNFKQKSRRKIGEMIRKSGKTVIFISHTLPQVDQICDKAILLEEGKIIKRGSTEEVIDYYTMMNSETAIDFDDFDAIKTDLGVELKSFDITDKNGSKTREFGYNDDIIVKLDFLHDKISENMICTVAFTKNEKARHNYYSSNDDIYLRADAERTELKLVLKNTMAKQGSYNIAIALWSTDMKECFFWDHNAFGKIHVDHDKKILFGFTFNNHWVINEHQELE